MELKTFYLILKKMKKILKWQFYLLALLTIGVCGCGKSLSQSDNVLTSHVSYMPACNFYSISNNGILLTGVNGTASPIKYVNMETGEELVLCDRVTCTHLTSSCPAVHENINGTIILGERLVYFESHPDKGYISCMSSDINGKNRSEICRLTVEDFQADVFSLSSGLNVFYSDSKAYFFLDTEDIFIKSASKEYEDIEFQTRESLVSVDLQAGTFQIIKDFYNLNEYSNSLCGIYKGKVLYSRMQPAESALSQADFFEVYGTNADYDKYIQDWYKENIAHKFYLLDLDSAKEHEIASIIGWVPEIDYSHSIIDGRMYYTCFRDINCIDMLTGDISCVYSGENYITIEAAIDRKVICKEIDASGDTTFGSFWYDIDAATVKTFDDSFLGEYGWVMGSSDDYVIGSNVKHPNFYLKKDDFWIESDASMTGY